MSSEQKIIDRILADAEAEAKAIIAAAKEEADELVAAAQAQADQENAVLMKEAEEEVKKAVAKTISGAEMAAKMKILSAKQILLEDAIDTAKDMLFKQTDAEYVKTISDMLAQIGITGGDVLLSASDKARIGKLLAEAGYQIAEETRDIAGGFILRKGDVEYNYSFSSILAIQREEMETIAASILFQ